MFITSKTFWADAIERAIKTAAQAAIAIAGTDLAGILEVDWVQLVSAAGLAAVLSLLTSVSSGGIGTKNTAGLTKTPVVTEDATFVAREETFGD